MFLSPFDENFQFVFVSSADAENYVLHPREALLLSPQASPKRKREFTVGRYAASLALKKLGFDVPPPVLQGSGREPLWPEGVVGSISHSGSLTGGDFAAAVVTRQAFASGVGIDLQDTQQKMSYDISRRICNDGELAWVNDVPEKKTERTLVVFSAKESVYKALYPVCKKHIGFHNATLVWNCDENEFTAVLAEELCAEVKAGTCVQGKVRRDGCFILSGVVLSVRNLGK